MRLLESTAYFVGRKELRSIWTLSTVLPSHHWKEGVLVVLARGLFKSEQDMYGSTRVGCMLRSVLSVSSTVRLWSLVWQKRKRDCKRKVCISVTVCSGS